MTLADAKLLQSLIFTDGPYFTRRGLRAKYKRKLRYPNVMVAILTLDHSSFLKWLVANVKYNRPRLLLSAGHTCRAQVYLRLRIHASSSFVQ